MYSIVPTTTSFRVVKPISSSIFWRCEVEHFEPIVADYEQVVRLQVFSRWIIYGLH